MTLIVQRQEIQKTSETKCSPTFLGTCSQESNIWSLSRTGKHTFLSYSSYYFTELVSYIIPEIILENVYITLWDFWDDLKPYNLLYTLEGCCNGVVCQQIWFYR